MVLTAAGLFLGTRGKDLLVWTPHFWIVNDFRPYYCQLFYSHDSYSILYGKGAMTALFWSEAVCANVYYSGSMLCFPIARLGKHPNTNIAPGVSANQSALNHETNT